MQWLGRTSLGMRWCEDLQKLEDSVKAVTQGSDWCCTGLCVTARRSVGQRLEARQGWAALCSGCRLGWAEQCRG